MYRAGAPAFHPAISSPRARIFVLFGIYPPVIQTSVLTQKNFAARKRCGASGSEFWLQD
jgi:hypothetical protein